MKALAKKNILKKLLDFFLAVSGVIIFSVLFLVSCQKDVNSYDVRLNSFMVLLDEADEAMVKNFEAGELSEVSKFLAEESEKNEEFQKELLKIKTFESIEFFSDEQVVSYFYDFFYKKKQL